MLVEQWADDVLVLTSSSIDGRRWDGGDHRIALHKPTLSESLPPRERPRIEGCWSDGVFGMTLAPDGSLRETTADDVRACLARGANPNAVSNCGEWTRPLSQASRRGNAAAVRALVAAGAEVSARDEAGETALHKAARYAKSDATLRALVDGGADPTLRDNAGRTASDYAKDNDALRDSAVLRALRDE